MSTKDTETWTTLGQCMTQPIAELAELNIRTLNKITKNSDVFNKFMHAKKPEDVISAQLEFANTAGNEVMKYSQEACGILLEAASHANKVFTDSIRETTQKASDIGRTVSAKSKE